MASSVYEGHEQQDLTKTTTLHRRSFAPALSKRFRALKGAIRTTTGYGNDALQLTANDPQPREQFQFQTRAGLVDAFMSWLQSQIDSDVLEVIERPRIRNGEHYTARYVRSAYQRGLRNASARMAGRNIDTPPAVGVSFNMPVHQNALQLIFTRTYDNLENITEDTATAVRRELTQALAEGEGPRKVASRINEQVDDIGLTRARTLSRTELSNAANTASANRYQRAGVEQVEILTSDPCPVCETLAAKGPYPVSEADSLIPGRTHPRCVCSIAPMV